MDNQAKQKLFEDVMCDLETRGIIVIRTFPDWDEKVFKRISSGRGAQSIQAARMILRSHLEAQKDSKQTYWCGMPPHQNRIKWDHNQLVTAYYLELLPKA